MSVVELAAAREARKCLHDWHEITTPVSDVRGRVKKDIVCRWCGCLRFPHWASIFNGFDAEVNPVIAAAQLRGEFKRE